MLTTEYKSHVSLEQNVCLVCCKTFDTNAILLDRRLKQSLEHHTVTGWGLCPEHKEKADAGYIALVGVDQEQSTSDGIRSGVDHLKPENAHRTGRVCHMRRTVFGNIFNTPLPDGPVAFVDDGVIDYLERVPVMKEA